MLPLHSQLVSRVQFAAKVTAKLFEEIAETQQRLTGQRTVKSQVKINSLMYNKMMFFCKVESFRLITTLPQIHLVAMVMIFYCLCFQSFMLSCTHTHTHTHTHTQYICIMHNISCHCTHLSDILSFQGFCVWAWEWAYGYCHVTYMTSLTQPTFLSTCSPAPPSYQTQLWSGECNPHDAYYSSCTEPTHAKCNRSHASSWSANA